METFKRFLVFPMMVTALWLFWVLGRQLGATSMFVGLLSATALAFALWAYGGGQRASRKAGWHAAVAAGVIMCVYMATQVEAKKAVPRVAGEAPAGKLGGLDLERFDPNAVRKSKPPVDGYPPHVAVRRYRLPGRRNTRESAIGTLLVHPVGTPGAK